MDLPLCISDFNSLFYKPEYIRYDDYHEYRHYNKRENLVVHRDPAAFAVVGKLFFVLLKAPYFGDEEADEPATQRKQNVSGKAVQPVVETVMRYTCHIEPRKLNAAENAEPKGDDNVADAYDYRSQNGCPFAPEPVLIFECADRYLEKCK